MAGRRVGFISEDTVSTSFEGFVIQSCGRLNMAAVNPDTSYDAGSYEAGLDDLWFSVPLMKKKEGNFVKAWKEIEDAYPQFSEVDAKKRQENTVLRCREKRQLLADLLFSINMLITAPSEINALKRGFEEMGKMDGKQANHKK